MENYKKLKTICNLLYIYICKEYKYKNMAKKTKNSNQKLLTDYYKSADKEKNETKIFKYSSIVLSNNYFIGITYNITCTTG